MSASGLPSAAAASPSSSSTSSTVATPSTTPSGSTVGKHRRPSHSHHQRHLPGHHLQQQQRGGSAGLGGISGHGQGQRRQSPQPHSTPTIDDISCLSALPSLIVNNNVISATGSGTDNSNSNVILRGTSGTII